MSDDLGPAFYGLGRRIRSLGRELTQPREYAEATAELDHAARRLVEEAHQQDRVTLEAHRPLLDALAGQLLAHETIEARELEALLVQFAPPRWVTRQASIP